MPKITIESFYDPSSETYAYLAPGLSTTDYETDAESVPWVIDSNKSDSLTLKETADKAAMLAKRFEDGTYNQTAFNKAYGIAFACVHCTGYTRGGVNHPGPKWEDVLKLTPSTSWQYPILDDTILNEYVRRATTFLLAVRPKVKEAPATDPTTADSTASKS